MDRRSVQIKLRIYVFIYRMTWPVAWLMYQGRTYNYAFDLAALLYGGDGARLFNFMKKQCEIETANFTSNLMKVANNLMGMRNASGRWNLQSGTYDTKTNGVFGKYRTYAHAVGDLAYWYYNHGLAYTQVKGAISQKTYSEEAIFNMFQSLASGGYMGASEQQGYLTRMLEVAGKPSTVLIHKAALCVFVSLVVYTAGIYYLWTKKKSKRWTGFRVFKRRY